MYQNHLWSSRLCNSDIKDMYAGICFFNLEKRTEKLLYITKKRSVEI